MARRNQDFQAIRSEGALLPPDLLRRLVDPADKLEGRTATDYKLGEEERLNESIISSWNRLQRQWVAFRTAAASLAVGEPGTGLTNEKWTLPLLRELGYGPLPTSAGPEIDGRAYPIERFLGPTPIHLVGCGLSLDRRAAGVRGAAAASPHGLVQEFLNRSDGHLWAIISNGLRLRLLRDNLALSRQSYLEFDLETMFEGEIYSDFVLLWLTAHASRFLPRDGARPESCWLEAWAKAADEAGTRALGELRGGVEHALQVFGLGFTSHPRNTALRDALRTGTLPLADFHGQLLRVVYRLIFLFVAEDRTLDGLPLLHPRDDSVAARTARERYAAHYGTARLRDLASRIKGSRHGDLWQQFQLLVAALSGADDTAAIRRELALPALGSMLWNPASTAALTEAAITNHDFLEALRNLAFTRQGRMLRPVDYRNLGAEELGGVYESLLALTPQINADGAAFSFAEFAGNERKTSGSYYTPDSLVQCLLDSALDPVVAEAIRGKTGPEAAQAILALKVCDPAVGSGHFLVGAAHRLARHLSRARALAEGESEPSPLLYQQSLRDVIGRCLYGVDINPMAAELCRVGLWLEALEPGKPLSFLDHHIRVGNSLLGTTPELIAAGLPDDAFAPIEGDDKKACAALKKRNKSEREGWGGPAFAEQDAATQERLLEVATELEEQPDNRPEEVRRREQHFRRLEQSTEFQLKKLVADTWCAAFVIPKHFRLLGHDPRYPSKEPAGLTQKHIGELTAGRVLPHDLATQVHALSAKYQFLHWHLAFPEVLAHGGFDCVLGNPPWERVKLQEKEWFAERSPEIANAPNAAARKHQIDALKQNDPVLYRSFLDDCRRAEGESHFLRNSDRFPLCGRGDINLYMVFAEMARTMLHHRGRAGCVLPTGIATDDTTKHFFQDVVATKSLVSLFDFENKGLFFPGVHSSFKFCLFTAGRGTAPITDTAQFVFFAHTVEELRNPDRRFTLSPEEIALLNPNTHTCPIFRSGRDAELTKAIYRRVPVLIREARDGRPEENSWGIKFSTMFHMSNDSHLFRTREQLEAEGWRLEGNVFRRGGEEYLPLYEAKMIHHFDHRWATYDGLDTRTPTSDEQGDPTGVVLGRYWVKDTDVLAALTGARWDRRWLLGLRDICRSTDERTVLFALMPVVGVGHTLPLLLSEQEPMTVSFLVANFSAFVLDYAARQKIGGTHLTYGNLNQLPVFAQPIISQATAAASSTPRASAWFAPRVVELTFTTGDLAPFAQSCGWSGPPFRWDEERRFLLRSELDAAFFHLYLPADASGRWQVAESETPAIVASLAAAYRTPRDAVAYIMDTFPIVRRKDEERYGEFRTRRVILEIYDAMLESDRTGQPYLTRLDPPPADPACCHRAR